MFCRAGKVEIQNEDPPTKIKVKYAHFIKSVSESTVVGLSNIRFSSISKSRSTPIVVAAPQQSKWKKIERVTVSMMINDDDEWQATTATP